MTDNQADAAAKQRDEAAKKHAEDTKKKLADEREARGKTAGTKEGVAASTPTPTQEENDLAASGVPVTEHEDDGSGPDPGVTATKQSEAKPQQATAQRGGYQTRTATPAKHE
ncbi:MAG TPA: hypothetical protein VGQ63_14040 [Pseudolabrys sp.]|jgi:hypothetical protein|nr:hypothetical protein [Pseudolabrys sp.]